MTHNNTGVRVPLTVKSESVFQMIDRAYNVTYMWSVQCVHCTYKKNTTAAFSARSRTAIFIFRLLPFETFNLLLNIYLILYAILDSSIHKF